MSRLFIDGTVTQFKTTPRPFAANFPSFLSPKRFSAKTFTDQPNSPVIHLPSLTRQSLKVITLAPQILAPRNRHRPDMHTFALLSALAVSAWASPTPQAVTSAIAPASPAPEGCLPSHDGKFQITVVNVSSTPSKRDLVGVSFPVYPFPLRPPGTASQLQHPIDVIMPITRFGPHVVQGGTAG